MRFPLGKIHRAFQELDQFDDAQCEWYLRRAKRRHLLSMFLVGVVAVPAAFFAMVVSALAEYWIFGTLEAKSLGYWFRRSEIAFEILRMFGIMFPVVVGLVTGLLIRDRWLRWAIGKELVRSTCPKCDYQLLGLPMLAGVVRCPECGLDTQMDVEVPPPMLGHTDAKSVS